ncbi:PEP-CTERM motif protein [Burkholderiales bacterium JOSHI_001]|nr:PEP-CTERM motif protein [Burkholderiales bacterium JOSHI_001]
MTRKKLCHGRNATASWKVRSRVAWLGLIAAAWFLPAQATIRTPSNTGGQGSELFFLAFDSAGPFTYTLDLGVFMDDFFNDAQPDAGHQRFWVVDPAADDAWRRLAAKSQNLASLQWTVLAFDSTGNATPGGLRLFTTVAQGNESKLAGMTNLTMETLVKNATVASLVIQTNNIGTPNLGGAADAAEQVAVNVSTLFDGSEGQSAQADATGLFPSFSSGTGAMGSPLNTVGQSSWFYYLTRSSTSNLASARVRVDEFDNLAADGYWGFIKESTAGSERYLLSYTLPAFTSALEQTAGITLGNNFARMAGVLSLSSAAGKGDAVLGLAEGFLRGMAQGANTAEGLARVQAVLPGALAPVPEPQTWTLLLGGLALVGAVARRRGA